VDTVSIPQIKELLTYEPSHLWFDTPHSMSSETLTNQTAAKMTNQMRFIRIAA
jgi:hypothetical protein